VTFAWTVMTKMMKIWQFAICVWWWFTPAATVGTSTYKTLMTNRHGFASDANT
jgi:hypothetical protein